MIEFRRSSFCTTGACVEVAMPQFRRSTFCANNACVEVAETDTAVLLRDTKQPDRAPLVFTREEWSAFVRGVKAGEFEV